MKFKTLEGKLLKQKSISNKMPKLEKSVEEMANVLSDDVCENLKSISEEIPKIQQLETKMEVIQEGHDEVEKSLGFLNEDTSSNKTEIERLEGIINQQQIAINKLITDNKKTKRKLENLQELVNTLDNRLRKFNIRGNR